MIKKQSLKLTGLKNKKLKLLIAIIILLSSLMAVASPDDTPPIADCGPDKLNCQNVNSPVQFNASMSYDPNGSILSYEWDFGDGTTGTGVKPNHTYTSYRWNGTAYLPFIVHLKITNNLGVTNTTSQLVTLWIAGDANGDGVVNILDASVVGLKWNSNDDCSDLNNDGKANILDASIIGLNWNRKASDNTPPAGVTQLVNVSFAENYINWTWTDPADTDFANVSVWIDGEFKSNVPRGTQFYEATGFTADSEHFISTRTTDISGNLNLTWVNRTARTAVAIELPPDPFTVAPPVDTTVATSIATSTSFLYTGSDPIQTGVAPGTIEARRAAVLRGRVLTREGTSISGVTITILSHPEFGSTMTREDGMFDMAVNGGGLLTVNYEKIGYLTAQRQVNAPWQDYEWLPDIVMIQADPVVTNIDFSSSAPIQVAQGSIVNDSDGSRQATLLFPQGVQANITLPDGTTQPLTNMHVRATEYTVGENGPEAMPAQLPPTSGYTYAVDLTVDEAMAKGASDVSFDKPVYIYVENFLNFPVGGIVPVGYYNRSLGQWIPSDNGLIIKILGITGGIADIDVNGSKKTANASQLTALNITDAERQQLAGLYQPDQSLWRVPIMHFTPWDCNWPYGPPPDATPPNQPTPEQPHVDDPCKVSGSIIGCQDQVLGEAVKIAGTPFRLHYQSDHVPGRKEAYSLEIPLSGFSVPANLTGIDLEVFVAGRSFSYNFSAAPNQIQTFTWDGKDAYGRILQGSQPVDVRIGYVYRAVYLTPAQLGSAFGAFGDLLTGSRARQEVIIWQEWKGKIGTWDARGQGLGGWSLNVHHSYDTSGNVLYFGDGRKRSAQSLSHVITTVAGNGGVGMGGDGGPATQAFLNHPYGVALGVDGSLFIADTLNSLVRRVGPDGIISTVAGNGLSGFSGDGGLATEAKLVYPHGVAIGSDGSLYIVDYENDRVRRVGPDGIITTVAGTGIAGFSGDGGPATQAQLKSPYSVAIGSDGSIYIADSFNNRVRRVGPDGIITTVAGTGIWGYKGDGGPANQAQLAYPFGVAMGADGSIYIGDTYNNRVRRVGPDGIITTVAGNGMCCFSGDGGQATQAAFKHPYGVAVGADGSIYITDSENGRVRCVGSDGIITTVAGTGYNGGFSGDDGPATQAQLNGPWAVAIGSDRSIYIADVSNNRVRRIAPALPDISLSGFLIPSDDGSELYVFNSAGRHLRTLEALTGALHYNFTYDNSGKLKAVTDGDSNIVTIERDANGNATAVVSPYGQSTSFTQDANGYIDSITNPIGESVQLNYTVDGLLTNMTEARGNIYRFSYDALGRLIKDEDPANGFKALTRTDITRGYSVNLTTGLNRNTIYQLEQLPTGEQKMVNTYPDGLKTGTIIGTNGSTMVTYADGMQNILEQGPDPRFGMQVPVQKKLIAKTPGGLTGNITSERIASLNNPDDLLSLKNLSEKSSINGRNFISTFDAVTMNFTSLTPMGRTSINTLDNKGRVVESKAPGTSPVHFTYDARGRLSDIMQGSRSYALRYDMQGNLASITDPLSLTEGFEYDPVGRITKQTFPDGRQVQYTYDANGNVIAITPPGRPLHAFNYTLVDLIKDYTPPGIGIGATLTSYTYNIDRDLIKVTRPDGAVIDLGYDNAGRLSMVNYPQGNTSLSYDAMTGNLKNITANDGGIITYGYDGSLLTDTNWSGIISGKIHRVYDNNFSIISESVNGNTVNFKYDPDGLLIQVGSLNLNRDLQNGMFTGSTIGNITDELGYNSFGEMTSYQAAYRGAGIFMVNYTRDDIGRIVKKNEMIDDTTHTYAYMYDQTGRLTNVSSDGVMISQYVYDDNGNRLSYTGSSGTIAGTYDNQDRLMKYGTTSYNYTANGELLSKTTGAQTTNYQYDVFGNLLNVTLPDGTMIEYVVDGQNRRIGKKVNGSLVQGFLYRDGLRPVAELDGSGNVVSRFVYAGGRNVPGYMVKSSATYRIVTDHLGSPRLVVNAATGALAQRIDYDEFGNVALDTNPGFQPFGFAGGFFDSDTNLIRFGSRDYDAKLGRWRLKDPIRFAGGDTNLYGYVLNDPINLIDTNGLDCLKWEMGEVEIIEGPKITIEMGEVEIIEGPKITIEMGEVEIIQP